MIEKYVIATNNGDKLREMKDILSKLGIECVSQSEAGVESEAEETGTTFYENARLKAVAVCGASGLPSIADDSGLAVDALGGAPGVYSKRYGGGLDSSGLCDYLLRQMDKMEQRDAKFVCSIVCAYPDGHIISAEGECGGRIAASPQGTFGFGYDPVFVPHGYDKTMAELTSDEKNAISHRGNALREFARRIMAAGQGE